MNVPRGFSKRLQALVGRTADADFEAEVRFHVEQQITDLIADGMDPECARAEAHRLFGDVEAIRSAVRRVEGEARMGRGHSDYRHDLIPDVLYAFRQMKKRAATGGATIGVIALGIAAAVTVFSYVDAAFLQPLPFPEDHDLYMVHESDDQNEMFFVAYPDFRDWERDGAQFEAITAFYTQSRELQLPEEPVRIIAARVDGDFLGVAGIGPVVGQGLDALAPREDEAVAMLGHGFWRQAYDGRRNVIGETIRINDQPYVIAGVMPPEADLLVDRTDVSVWLPMVESSFMTRGMHFLTVVGRAAGGLSADDVESRTRAMGLSLVESGTTSHGATAAGFRSTLTGDTRLPLTVLAGAVALLLLITCVNLASLALASSSSRMPEFAVRVALGARRWRIGRMLLTETTVVSLVGGALGVLGAAVALRWLSAQDGVPAIFVGLGLDFRAVAVGIGLAGATGAAFGAGSVLTAGRAGLAELLGGAAAGRSSDRGVVRRQRRMLVGVEAAISVVLLVGAALLTRSTARLLAEDPGFRPEGVLSVELPLSTVRYPDDESRIQFFDRLMEQLGGLPTIRAAGLGSHVPLSGSDTNGSIRIYGKEYPEDAQPTGKKRLVGAGYFEAMGIPLLAGRALDDRDRAGERQAAVVSQAFANRYWPDEDPIGQELCFCWGGDSAQIVVGVVGDIRHDGLDRLDAGTVYMSHAQNSRANLTLFVRLREHPARAVDDIQAVVRGLDPQQPLGDVATLEAVLRRSIAYERNLSTIVSLFGLAALGLASIGVYAVTAHSATRRRGEMGIRMALGARSGDVLRMVVSEELVTVGVGLAAGLVLAVFVAGYLERLLYGVTALDPVSFLSGTGLLVAIASIAAFVPARRAAALDPVRALRSD